MTWSQLQQKRCNSWRQGHGTAGQGDRKTRSGALPGKVFLVPLYCECGFRRLQLSNLSNAVETLSATDIAV